MNSTIERLLTLRVADVMNKRVVSISSTDTMGQAAQTLLQHSISGAPVLDEGLQCAGMISAIDFVKQQGCRCHEVVTAPKVHELTKPAKPASGCSEELVRHHMTPRVQSIGASEPLLSAARKMCLHHIHRLPVLDTSNRPTGMVTALDIVAALVNAVEE